MSSWNYYINLKINEQTFDNMVFEYNQNSAYQAAFHFGKIEGGSSDGYNVGIISVIDNFLPANHLIYNFLSHYISCDLYIKTNGVEHRYDFSKKSDFIKFMYEVWENKIDFVYDQLGVMVINHKQYHKTRNKLYKKYYVRIANPIKGKHNYNL